MRERKALGICCNHVREKINLNVWKYDVKVKMTSVSMDYNWGGPKFLMKDNQVNSKYRQFYKKKNC